MKHVQGTAALVQSLPSARAKVLGPCEQPGSISRVRDRGGAMLTQAMHAAGVTQRPLGVSLELAPATIADRCFVGGLDMAELDRLIDSPVGARVVRQVLELLEARLEGRGLAPIEPREAVMVLAEDVGELTSEVRRATAPDSPGGAAIVPSERASLDAAAAQLIADSRRLRAKPPR